MGQSRTLARLTARGTLWTFKGLATTTIVRGRVMMEDGETVCKPGWGRYVPRGPAAAGGTA